MTDTDTSAIRDDYAALPPAQMLALLERALAAEPDNVTALCNVGIMLTRMGRLEEGEAPLRRAIARDPAYGDAQFALAENLLGQGRFAEGWLRYGARERAGGGARSGIPQGLDLPKWAGEPLAGKRITIVPEQGLGDQIQFVRFVPRLVADGANVTMLARPALADLFRASFPSIAILVAQGPVKFPPSDYWVTLGGLPGVLGAPPAELPPPPYLRPAVRWSAPPPGFKVGLMTGGNPQHVNDAYRSLADDLAAGLAARLPGQVIDLDPRKSNVTDFAQTAALIDALDLVVSVDTAVAHLAGAMGKRCFLLLPGFNTDWRWMRGRDDSPWYPNHRLYRGTTDGGWGDAIDRLVADAQALATG